MLPFLERFARILIPIIKHHYHLGLNKPCNHSARLQSKRKPICVSTRIIVTKPSATNTTHQNHIRQIYTCTGTIFISVSLGPGPEKLFRRA
jgi:hypothetical protein